MESIQDKCYHVVCAIPVVQTVVGGAFAVKDLIGIIKDIAMTCIFTDYNKKTKNALENKKWEIENIIKSRGSNKRFFDYASMGNQKIKDKAIEGMKVIQQKLKFNGLLFPLSDQEKKICSRICPLTQENNYTIAYIRQALVHCKDEEAKLKFILTLTKVVPAKIRLYNLATNIISMIPTYRIGTLFNLAALGYHFFVKA